ncbi:Exfoliative toxin A [Streptococcus sp. DD10]|uniref:TDT family transporter n=1 Tax=Streptococcus sp. DD10 TaxID=1777878 RepID=UPI000795D2D7|nr:TDT family transporter [Streptococcus sp. DD10]KXT73656.1 Exfoliative toxin A [Streptococcus sp. DD10]
MKRLPLVFSGCLLGLAGAGNLVSDSMPLLSHFFSLTGLSLWIYFLISHLNHWRNSQQELKKPPLLSGMATFPMAGMILSTYLLRIIPVAPHLAQSIWWFSFLLDVFLISYFTVKFVFKNPRESATPSWTVLYVGIAVAALTYPVIGMIGIAYVTLMFGFLLASILYPLIYRDLKSHPLPQPLLGQEGIYCAPFSLLLAAMVRVGGASLPTWSLVLMVSISQACFVFVVTRLPKILRQGFQLSFSALTFPMIITATSLKMAQEILQFPLFDSLVFVEGFLSLMVLGLVLVGYLYQLKINKI